MAMQASKKRDGKLDLGQPGLGSPPQGSPGQPASAAVLAAIADGARRLEQFGPAASEGEEVGVHRMRTSVRRLRSALRAFAPLVDEAWAGGLKAELKWLAGALGVVRDLDVQQARLRAAAGELADPLTPLFAAMAARHEAARLALGDALRSTRCAELLRLLGAAAGQAELTDAAEEPCATALPRLVAKSWSKLKQAGRGLRPDGPPAAYHEARIRAKRARYAAESVAPALGSAGVEAERFARAAAAVQEILGEHQDAAVARDLLEATAAERPHDGPFALAIGRMIERQARAADDARERFAGVWEAFDRKRLRRWLKAGG